MTRCRLSGTVRDDFGNIVESVSVEVREPGTSTPIAQTLYADATSGTTLSNPLTTNAYGAYGAWLDTPQIVDLYLSGAGITPRTEAGVQVGGMPNLRLIDLGILNAVDLLAGPVTLYTPSEPEFVSIIIGEDDFVARNGNADIAVNRGSEGGLT